MDRPAVFHVRIRTVHFKHPVPGYRGICFPSENGEFWTEARFQRSGILSWSRLWWLD